MPGGLEPVALINIDPFTEALISAVILLLVVRFLDVWEREPIWILGLMLVWGGVVATSIAAPANAGIDGLLSPPVAAVWGPAIAAPLTEETTKGLALVIAFLISARIAKRSRAREFDGVTDGMVLGIAVGLGFALVENNIYFLNTAVEQDLRGGLGVLATREGFLNLEILVHGVYTGIFGAGLGLATWSRTRAAQIGFPVLGLAIAMLLHAFNNGLLSFLLVSRFGFDLTAAVLAGQDVEVARSVGAEFDATVATAGTVQSVVSYAVIAVFLAAMLVWGRHQRKVIAYELAEETNAGLITREEWDLIPRYGRRLRWYAQLLRRGRFDEWRTVRRVHGELAELAFQKWRVRRVGGDDSDIQRRREEIGWLRQRQAQLAAAEAPTG